MQTLQVFVWETLRRGSLKCEGEHYLKEELGQCYRINRLEDNGGRFLLRRVDRCYCTRIYYLENVINYYVPIQQDEACKKDSKYL